MTSGNKGASVRQRLLNQAKAAKADYNQVLIRYAIERLLYRLSVSPHRRAFVLKGAMLFAVWNGQPHRATQDLDLLGFGEKSNQRLSNVFRDICQTQVEDDGIVFDPDSITIAEIRPEDEYGGLRLVVNADLAGARLRVQVDIGFGDAITPEAVEGAYPALLADLPQPLLRTYPRETVVAEKLEAIVSLGMLNTRFKDYYDLAFLARSFAFEGDALVAAIANTFARRGTAFPDGLPLGLTPAFSEDPAKQAQWRSFCRRIGDAATSESLSEVVALIKMFLGPTLESAASRGVLPARWPVGGPWQSQ